MMTNKINIICVTFFSAFFYGQEVIDDFNNDKINDTLTYKCYKAGELKEINEPTCKAVLVLGKSKKDYNFNISYVSSPVISNCGAGCISVFDAAPDTEYTQEYTYFPKYDNWILTKNQTLYKDENGKIENNVSKKYLLSIDNKKYPMKKNHRALKRKTSKK
ncbi:hypothetical protein [Chryseobacterium jejuense]|uniref:Uncharacterized protein n=1 Tax=Chryseobacterium jejuense TaxID=445960 RepID=A0A2X2X0M2_CHRJE|nr:hypothetical protein [Chryseobacterium jejuense]SDI13489.1 hypothetical protein SAMN05421542_0178 [Chryseobacterium jejuense]SQB46448.1 Uncharacterised protein [Chryseobacterium jejuense]